MSHLRYSMMIERSFIQEKTNQKQFPFQKINTKRIVILTHAYKTAFGGNRLLEVFFRFEQKNDNFFYINFYFDPIMNTWEMKEFHHLSRNPFISKNFKILYIHENHKRTKKEIKKQIEQLVFYHDTIQKLPFIINTTLS
ncbi:TPA: hypothetical protein ACGW5B_005512 [Bacillus paranthracis]|uniref:hypothetical protein n=1 Tax=Bacillus sp. FSL W8-0519 TaxID=2954624 RepID=UPI00027CCB40|nr:hypothetical protein BCK_27458 [Bacillus cereus FRI-35]